MFIDKVCRDDDRNPSTTALPSVKHRTPHRFVPQYLRQERNRSESHYIKDVLSLRDMIVKAWNESQVQ